MQRILRWAGLCVLLSLVGVLMAQPAAPDQSVSASLKSMPLDSGGPVVSKTDGTGAEAQIYNGTLFPTQRIEFNPVVSEYGLKIAGQKVALISTDKGFCVKGDSGKPHCIKPKRFCLRRSSHPQRAKIFPGLPLRIPSTRLWVPDAA